MTMKEASERYQIPVKILKEYELWAVRVCEEGDYGSMMTRTSKDLV